VERKDVEAALEARKELERRPAERPHLDLRLPLGSIALGVGATAVATSDAGGAGGVAIALVAWIAIALVNLAYARRYR